jgi:bifunctional UDP-N-acetylglucosamine pyrophosphorylase/glucosamine-1-phosphate N-acetyltransferase
MTTPPLAILVLAAGQGTRMLSRLPKVLHRIANRPLIEHVLTTAAALAPDRLIVVLAPGMTDVAAAVNAAAPEAETVVQAPALGTGHAVAAARTALAGFAGDVLVIFGDTPLLTPTSLQALLAERRRSPGAALAVAAMRPAAPEAYGRLVLDTDGGLAAIVEAKDASPAERAITLCNSGVMVIAGEVLFDLIDALRPENAKGEYYLTDIVAIARRRGLACRHVEASAESLLGVNSRADLALAEAALQQRLRAAAMASGATLVAPETVFLSADTRLGRDTVVGPFVVFGPGVTIGEGVEIPAFSHIVGATVGDRAIIGPFARLRPGAELGPEVHIGNFVEIKNARIEAGAKANHLTYIGDAVVGARSNIGAGTITCNYDGFTKSTTRIGSGVFIGSNAVLVAPVAVGDGAYVAAGSVITGDVAPDALALARGRQVEKPGRAAAWRQARAAARTQREKP